MQLRKINEVDDYLRFNAFVLSGYRSRLRPNQCVMSIFQLHNETGLDIVQILSFRVVTCVSGNIWFHLLPLFFFLYSSLRPWEGAPWYFVSATVPSALCLICSIIYHTFMAGCSSKESYNRLLFVDYLSVFNTMVWPETMVIGWSFACHPTLHNAALTGIRNDSVRIRCAM
jgi:hypothetical protein